MESMVTNFNGTVKEIYLTGPILARLYPSRRFYINTDCPKDGMLVVLLQEYVSEKSRKLEAPVKGGEKCVLYKSL